MMSDWLRTSLAVKITRKVDRGGHKKQKNGARLHNRASEYMHKPKWTETNGL